MTALSERPVGARRRGGAGRLLSGTRLLSGFAVLTIAVAGFGGGEIVSATPAQAVAEGLPTWDDVQEAKKSEGAAAAKVTEIEGLIEQVQEEVEQTKQEAAEAADAARVAEEALQEAAAKADTLDEQAAQSEKEADEAAEQASALVSQLYRSGGIDRNMSLFLESDEDTADQLLERLASMSKATERNTSISEEAERAMNSAKSLGEQAELAKEERDRLYAEAEEQNRIAAEAANAALEKLEEQEEQERVLKQQLAALKDETTDTVEGYEERLRLEEQERQRILEEQRKAAERAARQGGGGGGGGGDNSGGGGGGGGSNPPPSSGGWTRPLSGGYYVSCEYLCYGGHYGIDLATYGQALPVYAARSGTVQTGWEGFGYGNYVFINHGGGLQTRYAHLSRFNVSNGQSVSAGQLIGYVGSTGNSTGPHLHFEIRQNLVGHNPRNYMGF